jgi:hypothetical protein
MVNGIVRSFAGAGLPRLSVSKSAPSSPDQFLLSLTSKEASRTRRNILCLVTVSSVLYGEGECYVCMHLAMPLIETEARNMEEHQQLAAISIAGTTSSLIMLFFAVCKRFS